MTHRYFAANLPIDGGIVSLDESESHHALNVMRIRTGETITLFDGIGKEAPATVQTVGRRVVVCESLAATSVDRENRLNLTLGVAMPKGDRAKDLVERLTELGVNSLIPLHCQRTQWPVSENAIAKWRRVMIDACKQSGRNQFMVINSPVCLNHWLALYHDRPGINHYFAHSAGAAVALNPQADILTGECCIAIGPEGGFSDDEVAIADANGWQRLSLGNRTYRIETAAIVAAVKLANI